MELLWPYINNSNHEVQLLSAPIHTWRGYSPEEATTVMTAEEGKKLFATGGPLDGIGILHAIGDSARTVEELKRLGI